MSEVINTHLFIGGPMDGERLVTRPDQPPRIRFSVLPARPVRYTLQDNPMPDTEPYTEAAYRREMWRSNGKLYAVWVFEEISNDEAFVRLVEHYRPTT